MNTRIRLGLLVATGALTALAVWLFANDHPLRALPVVMLATFCVLTALCPPTLPRSLLAIPSIVVVGFIITMVVGWGPQLGLDLQGGVSVVLKPVAEPGKTVDVPEDALDETKAIIERRVNAFGVGEPDITRQGKTIVVQIPGIKDQQRALDLVGKTAELRFRPVLAQPAAAPTTDQLARIDELRAQLKIPEGVSVVTVINDELAKRGETQLLPGDPTTTTTSTAPAATVDPNAEVPPTAPATTAAGTGAALGTTPTTDSGGGGGRSVARRFQASTTEVAPADSAAVTTTAPGTSTTTTTTIDPSPKNQFGIPVLQKTNQLTPEMSELYQLEVQRDVATKALTSPDDDKADQPVTLEGREETDKNGNAIRYRYELGPTLLTGRSVETATAGLNSQNGQWEVRPTFREGPEGIDAFNAVATKCYSGDPVCPTKQLAIVLDGEVISAPSINSPTFQRDSIQISGSFDEKSAKDLALALRFGSLPIQLQPQQIETVSATLGEGALRAGLIAGAVGLALVAVWIVAYYRMLGLITIASLSLSAASLWVIISLLGEEIGLTLTLSGIVGIIVSIGTSLDSSVVYFENLKEDVKAGRTVRSAIDRSFVGAFSTMLKADLSSLIGAVILYLITVGPVKGFAFYLGLSTILDLTFTYFFLHPVARLLVNSRFGTNPRNFGIPVDPEPSPNSPIGIGAATA